MGRSKKWIIYGIVIITLAGVALSGPAVWATPGQSPENQTVPKPTPKPPPRPDPDKPDPGQPPPPGATVAPGLTVAPGITVTTVVPIAPAQAQLVLQKRADRREIWPGATVIFTLTLSNQGATSVQRIAIADTLPPGLEPGEVREGRNAVWDGRTLRAPVAVLPPGGEYTIVFTALAAAPPGPQPELTNVAQASTASGSMAVAQVVLVWPPPELPPVGGAWAALTKP